LAWIRNWWQLFSYNYAWSDWVAFIDGWIPRFCFFFPVVGYLILFNDQVVGMLEFQKLTREPPYEWGLGTSARLRCIYYALFFLGISNLIYRLKRPFSFRYGTNLSDYTRNALGLFTIGDFMNIHETVRYKGHLTLDGKYYDSEWEGFTAAALNAGEGTDQVERTGHWEDAKQKYGSLLRSMLRENFFRQDIGRRTWLSVCLVLSAVGYTLLAVPSIDLFAKVTSSTFGN
jgi:hypothetical protein